MPHSALVDIRKMVEGVAADLENFEDAFLFKSLCRFASFSKR